MPPPCALRPLPACGLKSTMLLSVRWRSLDPSFIYRLLFFVFECVAHVHTTQKGWLYNTLGGGDIPHAHTHTTNNVASARGREKQQRKGTAWASLAIPVTYVE